ncbi:hypothetical protein BN1708_010774 [Verticillium longisporum]|uniref:Prenyltransferase alpha-alpha toroid domain-containing protein n=1 Tax=Verticillium longisporum TaxID=100787 RepID=A0A0G4KUN2_VERLO|nr:hypothetical protein BN1708_010774 [Verticillium longisporum]
MADPTQQAPLDKERHLRYWQRCYRSFLPTQYTSHDSIRMALGFFIVAAFDILSPATSSGEPHALTPSDRSKIRKWVLSQQHVGGGFSGAPSHTLPAELCRGYDLETNKPAFKHPDVSTIAATYFALLLLALVDDGTREGGKGAFAGVDRVGILRWLRRLQREDGSFGDVLVEDGAISGGRDMRLCYLAATIRWCLRGDVKEGEPGWVEDIDVDALIGHIRQGQTYDGGVAESSQHEAHAGYAYCAIGALYMLDRPLESTDDSFDSEALRKGVIDREGLIKFLVHRQFAYLERQEQDAEENDPDVANFALPRNLADLSLEENKHFVGFNGRCNKVADTCYCWWVGGTLAMLSQTGLIANAPSRNFLLSKTQHIIGGFAKYPGGPPDVHHAYLGLAALATMGDSSLRDFDAGLCVSTETVDKIRAARAALTASGRQPEAAAGIAGAGVNFWKGKQATWPKNTLGEDVNTRLSAALKALG